MEISFLLFCMHAARIVWLYSPKQHKLCSTNGSRSFVPQNAVYTDFVRAELREIGLDDEPTNDSRIYGVALLMPGHSTTFNTVLVPPLRAVSELYLSTKYHTIV